MRTEENQPSHKQIHTTTIAETLFVVCVSNLMFILESILLCVCGSICENAH